MQMMVCYTKTPNSELCKAQEQVCTPKCLEPYLPDCLQNGASRVLNCMKEKGNITTKPKDCAGVNIVIKCLQTECNDIPKFFATTYRLDELSKKLCPTLSPTVVGGTLSPT